MWLTTGSFLLLCRAFVSLSAASVKSMVRVVLSTCDSQLSTQPHDCFYIFFKMVVHSPQLCMIVVLGVVNLVLGAFMAYLYLTQVRKIDPRKDSKYKRKK